MNKTRKLTQGAMFIAIVGAMMLLDTRIGFFLSPIVVILSGVVIIMYSTMYTIKDGFILTVALGVIMFIYGIYDPELSAVLYPAAAITGLLYSYGLKRSWDKTKLLIVSMVVFAIGELLSMLVITPLLLNMTVAEQMAQLQASFQDAFVSAEEKITSLIGSSEANVEMIEQTMEVYKPFETLLTNNVESIFILICIFTGALEGLIIHLLSIILLKRFRIKEIPIKSFLDRKPNKIIAYACMISFLLMRYFSNYAQSNQTLFGLTLFVGMLAEMYLIFYGYMYLITWGKIRFNRNIGIFVIIGIILLMPSSLIILMCVGFLYAVGILYDNLQHLIREKQNEKNNII